MIDGVHHTDFKMEILMHKTRADHVLSHAFFTWLHPVARLNVDPPVSFLEVHFN